MAVTTLFCYAHEDERMVSKLKKHLSSLMRNQLIIVWDYGDIKPGAEWQQERGKYLDEAQMILLFISDSFLSSNYCFTVEMGRAIQRHERKEAPVVPIILRPVYWNEPPLDKLRALPDRDKPILKWTHPDDGYKNVVEGLVKVIKQWDIHSLADPIMERSVLLANLNQLIEAITIHIQPPPRANAIAGTLQQLSIFIPNDVALADLVVGWQTLSYASQPQEELKISQRRVTCSELAHLASQFTTEQGNLAQAVKTWHMWRDAFTNSNDSRQKVMAETFTREITELQAALRTSH